MEEFNIAPRCGHLDSQATKSICLTFKSAKTTVLKDICIICMTKGIQ